MSANEHAEDSGPDGGDRPKQAITYLRFLLECGRISFSGTYRFYAWMAVLTAIGLVGLNAFGNQLLDGMARTNMSDHVSWGLYIANFTFMVGLAAGAVMMVIPAYLYEDEGMHDVVIIGEMLAIAAIVMALAFVNVDLGRIDRFWHVMPGVGQFNWPYSMLSWDIIVLSGYLLLNIHIAGYLTYTRFIGEKPRSRWYVPFVFLSIGWAVSIHTVTAFLYSGLGGRPFWNTAILAPRFLVSAFVVGPAFIIITLKLIRRWTTFHIPPSPIEILSKVLRVTILINLFFIAVELFTQFYTGGSHSTSAKYLYFGSHGHSALVPWIWTAMALELAAAVLLLTSTHRHRQDWRLVLGCVFAFVGIWIEKGMGLVVPGFIPSTLHEYVEYTPSITEWKITAGIWALGLGIFTILLKITIQVWTGKSRLKAPAGANDGSDRPGSDS